MRKLLICAVLVAFALPLVAYAQERGPAADTPADKDKGAAKDAKDSKDVKKGEKAKDSKAPKKKADEAAEPKKSDTAAQEPLKADEAKKAPAAAEEKAKPAAPLLKEPAPAPAPAKKKGVNGDEAIEEGLALFKAGRYPDSADVLSTAVGLLPNYPRASLLLANAQFAIGNFEASSEELIRGLHLTQNAAKELTEVKESWRDYVLLKQRIDGLGRLVEANPEDLSLKLLYGYYYGIAGYREYANRVLRSIPSDSDEGPAVATLLRSKFPKKPWVDLPPPVWEPSVARRGARPIPPPYPPPPPPHAIDITRHLNIGFGFGGNIINGQIQSAKGRTATEGYGAGRFFVGFLVEHLEIDFNFGWQALHGDIWLPNLGLGHDVNLNLYTMGLEVAWHFLNTKRAKGFDPSVRIGYAFIEMEAGDWANYGDYYYTGSTAAVGHGPIAGVSLDYVFVFLPLDITLGLDVFYQVMIMRDESGNPLDGGALNIQGKVGFRF